MIPGNAESKPRAGRRFDVGALFFSLVIAGGCGAPGEPHPPAPPIPVAISDLAARQSGEGATLTFTAP
ncbi:MAG TPA: hypothetical protein VEH49_01305, partial [Methylomirabilota bacterium]|nr:hypothetical protein [Methylomirabilota bacterium]